MMSRWEVLFGTPEKAAETIDLIVSCVFYDEDTPSPDLTDVLCVLRDERCLSCPANSKPGNVAPLCGKVSVEMVAEWLSGSEVSEMGEFEDGD